MRRLSWAGVLPLVLTLSLFAHGGDAVPQNGTFIVADTSGTTLRGLENGDVLNVDILPAFTIAVWFDSSVESVLFGLDDDSNFRVENVAPYVLTGDTGGIFFPLSLPLGVHTVTATPYAADNLGGEMGKPVSVTFTLAALGDVSSVPAIVSTPPTSVVADVELQYQTEVTDAELPAETFTYVVIMGPGSIDMDGLYTYTPSAAEMGPQFVRIEVTDTSGFSGAQEFTLEVLPNIPQALVQVTPNSTSLIFTSTFNSDSFVITNESTNGQKIVSVSIDVSTAVFTDIVFDPDDGTPAGNIDGKCLEPNIIDIIETGFVEPLDICVDPYSVPELNGFLVLTTEFTDFDPGESFGFAADLDALSIQGTALSGASIGGEIAGLEMSGSVVTVEFDDGTTVSGELAHIPGTATGSQVLVKEGMPSAPTLAVDGSMIETSFSNNEAPIATIVGPAGSDVTLHVLESTLEIPADLKMGFDLQPFEVNTAYFLTTIDAMVGASGMVDIPFTFSEVIDENDSIYLLYAVVRDPADEACTGPISNVLRIDFDPPPPPGPPVFTSIPPTDAIENGGQSYLIEAFDPDGGTVTFMDVSTQPFMNQALIGSTLGFEPNSMELSTRTLTIRAIDDEGEFTDQEFEICVRPQLNTPPTIDLPLIPGSVFTAPNLFSLELPRGSTFALTLEAFDVDPCDSVSFDLELSFDNPNFDGVQLNAVTGEFSFTPTAEGFYFIAVNVFDESFESFTLIFEIDVVAPAETLILVDASTGDDLMPLLDGDVINVDTLPPLYAIRAEFPDPLVESVLFGLDGVSSFRIESVPPYALNGDFSGVFFPVDLSLGLHTVSASPFAADGASGSLQGAPIVATFTLAALGVPQGPEIVSVPPMDPVFVDTEFTYPLMVEDPNPMDSFTFDVVSGPGSIDPSGVFTYSPVLADDGMSLPVTVAVTDSTGLMDMQSFMIDVITPQFPPEIVSVPGLLEMRLLNMGSVMLPFSVEATDPNGDDSLLTWTAAPGNALLPSLSGPGAVQSGLFLLPPKAMSGPLVFTLRVTDEEGLFTDVDLELCVHPAIDTPPMFTTPISSVNTIFDGDVFEFDFDALEVDPCDSDPEFQFTGSPLPGASLDSSTGQFSFDASSSGLGVFNIGIVALSQTFEGFVGSAPTLFMIEVVDRTDQFILVDSVTNEDIGPLVDGQFVAVNDLPNGSNFTIRAEFASPLGSVVFDLDGIQNFRIENLAPFVVSGDINGDVVPLGLSLGMHTITATAKSGPNGSGAFGPSITVSFTLIDEEM